MRNVLIALMVMGACLTALPAAATEEQAMQPDLAYVLGPGMCWIFPYGRTRR
jgi:hypothetical protein